MFLPLDRRVQVPFMSGGSNTVRVLPRGRRLPVTIRLVDRDGSVQIFGMEKLQPTGQSADSVWVEKRIVETRDGTQVHLVVAGVCFSSVLELVNSFQPVRAKRKRQPTIPLGRKKAPA